MSIKKTFLKPVCKRLIAEFAKEGERLGTNHAYNLIAAAFGIKTHDKVREYNIPFTNVPSSIVGAVQFHETRLVAQVKESCATFIGMNEWKAQHFSSIVMEVIRDSGLRVEGVKVLLNPEFEATRSIILAKALRHPTFPPSLASVAIASGDLPPPPFSSLRDRINFCGPHRMVNGMSGTLHNFISEAPTYLWVDPPADYTHANFAQGDSIIGESLDRASIGLNFAVLQPFKLRGSDEQRMSVVSATIHFDRRHPQVWSQVGLHMATPGERPAYRPLIADYFPEGIERLPRLHVCPTCLAIYSDDLPELARTCDCADTGRYGKVMEFLAGLRAAGTTETTTIDIRRACNPNGAYLVDEGTTVEESANAEFGRWLKKNQATFGIRHLEQIRAKDDHGSQTTTAKWFVGGIFTN